MWSASVSAGCIAMCGSWVAAFALIAAGWIFGQPSLGQTGLALSAVAAALTVVRDNTRTRRMIEAHERRRSGGGGGGSNIRQMR